MAPTVQERVLVHATTMAVLLLMFLDATHAVQWTVGGDAKWSYLHADAAQSYYNDWAASKTFVTGDSLLFDYDNATHTVLQLATGSDFLACNLKVSVTKWTTGQDSVFISKAGTYYYVCGAPSHCQQGMKFSITATGDYVAAPPGNPNGTIAQAPTASHAGPTTAQLCSGFGTTQLIVAMTLAATLAFFA